VPLRLVGSEMCIRDSFQSTGDAAAFGKLARRFLGPEVAAVEHLAN
jgi:hypothetical protein